MALVLTIKIAFYWLQAKGYESMAKMKAINPKVMAMRERLKDNPQQMQQEMMRIYKEEKVNPLGGCLPIFIQIPVFIALYWVLLSSVEMRNAPWIGWIHDLSTPDPFFILPAMMTLTSLLQTALNPVPPDPMQAKMMWIMPLAFSVMFFFFPAGLVLYWITNNILSIAQQWLINVRMGVPPEFNLPKFGKARSVIPAQAGTQSVEEAACGPLSFWALWIPHDDNAIPPCSPASTNPSPPSPPPPAAARSASCACRRSRCKPSSTRSAAAR
jgi:YidC/Oxa1 family membrane protein insertase